jgi:hypothetical protein
LFSATIAVMLIPAKVFAPRRVHVWPPLIDLMTPRLKPLLPIWLLAPEKPA